MIEEILKFIDAYWKFDEAQQPMSSWHDKQDLLTAIEQLKNCNLQSVTASILKDKDSFENDMAAATLNVMLKHKVVTGYKGDFGRWINCETKFRYLSNAGGIYVESLDFAATESDYHR